MRVHVSSQGGESYAGHTLYTGEVGRVPVKASKVQRNGSRNDVARPRSTGQVRRAFDRVQSGFVEPRLLSQPR